MTMGGWNYRIIRHCDPLPKHMMLKKNRDFWKERYPDGYIEWFAIHEVFYRKNGKPFLVTEEPIKVTTEEFKKSEFKRVLRWMKLAVDKPILNYKGLKEYHAPVKSSNRRNSKRSKAS